MTGIVGDNSARTAMMLDFINKVKQRKMEKAQALISSLKPGETLASVPGALQAYKRLTGHAGDPNRVLTDPTLQQVMDKSEVPVWQGLSHEMQKRMSTNAIFNQVTGTSGVQTEESYGTDVQTAGVKAKTGLTQAQTEQMSAQDLKDAMAKLPVGQRVQLAQNAYINKATGLTGVASGKSYASDLTTQEQGSAAKSTVVTAANKGIQDAAAGVDPNTTTPESDAQRANRLVGEKGIFGETVETTASTSGATVADNAAKTKSSEIALKYLNDPVNSEFGKELKKAGINPMAAAQAFASGEGTAFTGLLDLKQARIAAQASTEGKELDLQKVVAEGKVNAAEDLSKKLQGRLGVQSILAFTNAVENGQDPYSLVVGKNADGTPQYVSKEDVDLWKHATALGSQAFLQAQAQSNDPDAQYLNMLKDNAKTFTKNPKMASALNTLMGQQIAIMQTKAELGMDDPGPADPKNSELFHKRVDFHYGAMALTGRPAVWFFQSEKDNSDILRGFGPFQANSEVDTGQSPSDATKTSSKGKPKMVDPDAARAVSAVLKLQGDSTLMRK